jgi:hypothetical protein
MTRLRLIALQVILVFLALSLPNGAAIGAASGAASRARPASGAPAPRQPARSAPAAPAPLAQEVAVLEVTGGAELRVRGRPVLMVLGDDARTRLESAARILEPLLPEPTKITAEPARRAAKLIVDNRPVITVTRKEALRFGYTPVALVTRWASALRAALAVRPITLSPKNMVLSPGYAQSVAITTTGAAPVSVGPYDARVVSVTLLDGTAEITGRAVGAALVPFRLGPYRAYVAVSVRPPAGEIPADADVVVTGTPATPDLIREAVERRMQEVVKLDPGAVLEVGSVTSEPVPPGGTATVPVEVTVRSPYAGPARTIVQVRVTNEAIELADPGVLHVSNRPEIIRDNGWLFNETLAPGRPTRLLYHHANGTPGQVRVLKITLANPGTARARIHYLNGLAGPSPDSIFIGFVSTQRFLDALVNKRGYIVEVPPKQSTTFTAYTLSPLALVSGLMQLQVVEGGPIDLVVHVRVPYLLDRTVTKDLGPGAFPHPRGSFPGPVVEVAKNLPAAQGGEVADLGVMANLLDPRTFEPLVGDYGVLYRIRLRLVNTTARDVSTALIANAAGGFARGYFIIDGRPIDIGLVPATQDREVATLTVPAGIARDFLVLTMPVAGSFYPVRLTVRPKP